MAGAAERDAVWGEGVTGKEELALLRKSGVKQLVDWCNKAEGRIDGLGILLLLAPCSPRLQSHELSK